MKHEEGGHMSDAFNGPLDGKPDESGIHMIRACGPWALLRPGFTKTQENKFMTKWLRDEHIKIKV
jgi:hypothetical protein